MSGEDGFISGRGGLMSGGGLKFLLAGGQEPMGVLQQSNGDAYIIFQLGVAAMFTVYAMVHIGMLCSVQVRRGGSKFSPCGGEFSPCG
eukprot:1130966-Prorocentrum_minimum.AAC.1